ncbi:MAG: O-antigen ligase family protein [Calditrichaceae bacterium]
MYPELGDLRIELIAAIVVFISIAFSEKGFANILTNQNSISRYLWLFFLVGMLSVPQALDVAASWQEGGYELLKMVLFYIMIVSSVQGNEDLKKLVWTFVLMTVWIGYEPVVNYLTGVVIEEDYGAVAIGRFGAAAGHVALANTLNQGIPLIYFSLLYEKRSTRRFILWAALAFVIIGVIVSKSRGGFLGFLAIGAGIIYFTENRGRAIFYFVVVFFVTLPLAGGEYIDHIMSILDGIHGSRSSSDRFLGLINGIDMLFKRPLLGVGIGCFAEARSYYFSYRFESHNLYGELIGELGLSSIVWFIWMYWIFKRASLLKSLLNTENDNHNFYFNMLNGVQLGLFVRLFLGNFTHGSLIWFWFFMAALVSSIDNLIFEDEEVIEYLENQDIEIEDT